MASSQEDQMRFWSKVDKQFLGCWLWSSTVGKKGYASFRAQGKTSTAHRFIYQVFNGPVGKDSHVDHLCRVRHCVNPSHLEAVSLHENVVVRGQGLSAENSRKTHCKNGHEFTGKNLSVVNGGRRCVTCLNKKQREKWRDNNPGLKTRILRGHVSEVSSEVY